MVFARGKKSAKRGVEQKKLRQLLYQNTRRNGGWKKGTSCGDPPKKKTTDEGAI